MQQVEKEWHLAKGDKRLGPPTDTGIKPGKKQ